MTPDAESTELLRVKRVVRASGLLALAIVAGAVYFFGYRPLAKADDDAQARAQAIASFLQLRESILADHASASKQLRDCESRRDDLLARIPDAPKAASFLAQISELSNDAGVRIRQFTPGVSRHVGNYVSLEVNVSAEASYDALCRFLDGLTRLPRLSEVTGLSLSDVDSTAEVYPLTLRLRIYYAPLSDMGESDEEAIGA